MRSYGRGKSVAFLARQPRRHGRRHEDPLASSLGVAAVLGLAGLVAAAQCGAAGRHAGDGAHPRASDLRRGRWAQGLLHASTARARGPASASTSARPWRRPCSAASTPSSFAWCRRRERFSALQSGEIDVLSRNVAMTSSRDTELGIRFPGVLVFDGQGFMVRKSQGVASALELSGARICVVTETADAQGIADYFGALKMPFELSKHDDLAGRRHGLRQQELPGAVGGRLRPGAGAPAVRPSRATTSSCRRSPRSSWSDRRCGRATRTGSAWCAGPSMR